MEPTRITAVYDIDPWETELTAALANDLYGMTFQELSEGVTAKQYVALEVEGQACCVLELVRGGGLHVIALGGTGMAHWLSQLWDVIRNIAREQGCTRVTLNGRLGWVRELKRLGFSQKSTIMAAEV